VITNIRFWKVTLTTKDHIGQPIGHRARYINGIDELNVVLQEHANNPDHLMTVIESISEAEYVKMQLRIGAS
jgi:hypothetical protein